MKMKKSVAEGITKIHNVRFYNLEPRSINCMAFKKHNRFPNKIALSRPDGTIEIWDMQDAPFLEKILPAEGSVEGLAWAGERLFSVGLTGAIIEWDLITLRKKREQLATGNAIWCIDINTNEQLVAIGTDEGYVNIFDIADDSLTYKTLFDKQEGRILCCKFDWTGEFVVTGSIGAIRIWNAKTGHALEKITLGRTEAKRETIVWSLQVLRDFSIISGDSRGQLNVWDGKTGTQIESHQALKADVLSVTVNEEENILMCSGIDPVIRIYALTSIKKEDQGERQKWIRFLQRAVHDHDVKTVVCAGSKVLSGGIDGYLGISSYNKFHSEINKYGPFLGPPCASIATEARLILLRYPNYLEMWHLGQAANTVELVEDEQDSRKFLSLDDGPEKLLELKSVNSDVIVSSDISSDGSWLIYSTFTTIRLFMFSRPESGQKPTLTRAKDLPEQFTPSLKVLFSSDSKQLFLVKNTKQIDVFSILSNGDIDYIESINATKYIKDVIHIAKVSPSGRYFVAAGTCGSISVWIKTSKHWKHHINLPKYHAAITTFAMHQNSPRIVVSFANGKIFEYDLEEMCFTCSTMEEFVENSYTHCVNNIILDPRNENIFILHNDTNLFVLEKVDYSNKRDAKKTMKLEVNEDTAGTATLKLKFKKSYEHFVHLALLSSDEMVIVGVNPVALAEQLPSALRQKKFGAA